jgi:acyl phosphate:glycerol-3-phosphate acyltransferase
MTIFFMVLLVFSSYLIGSIPTGYWLAKIVKGIDIRQHGSGSTGATNVWRCVGKAAGVSVFLIDVLKGALPVGIAVALNSNSEYAALDRNQLLPLVVALTALVGHSKSIFLNFQGGKSAATGLGTLFALNPTVGFVTFVSWLSMVYAFRLVSLASIVATAICGIYMAFAGAPTSYVAYCILGFIYVTYRHKANVQRLLNGTEPRLGSTPADLTSAPAEVKNDSIRMNESQSKAESK